MKLDCHSAPARGLRRYVRLVAEALGPNVSRSVVYWGHPVDAYLTLNDRLRWFPARDVALDWNASEGWTMILTAYPGRSPTVLRYYGGDLLPDPVAVAMFSERMFRDEFTGQLDPPPEGTADARDIVARLGRYAGPYRVRHQGVHRVHLHGVITSWHARA